MAITIKEINSADQVSEMVDKINFNFDQLLINGGGPEGPQGDIGGLGPLGPRGSVWFTAIDLFTTETSPSWTGSPEKVNDPNLPGFPQFGGDPNRYLPVGQGVTPEDTYEFGSILKPLRGGDMYLQEGDDDLDGEDSFDGDVWEYDDDNNIWIKTGVNIKGEDGTQGTAGAQEWQRLSDGPNDILVPDLISGQNLPRIAVGTTSPFTDVHPLAKINAVSEGDPQLSLGHTDLDETLYPTFTVTSSGDLILQGSSDGTSKQVIIQADESDIILDGGDSISFINYQINSAGSSSAHIFSGGAIQITSADNNSNHFIQNTSGNKLSININTTDDQARIFTDTASHLILQSNNQNVGIGSFTGLQPASNLAVAGEVAIGNIHKTKVAPSNGLLVEGSVGIGNYSTGSPGAKLTILGSVAIGSGFKTTTPGSSNSLIVENRLGINTSAPAELLHVSSSSDGDGAILAQAYVGNRVNNGTQSIFTHTSFRNNTDDYALLQNNVGATFLNAKSGNPVVFRIGGTAGLEAARFDSNGNFMVNTTSASGKARVNGTMRVDDRMTVGGQGFESGVDMRVNNRLRVISGGVRTDPDGPYFFQKTVVIGPWNMDADSFVNVAHGLPSGVFRRVVGIDVFVRDDNVTISQLRKLNSAAGAAGPTDGWVVYIDNSIIRIRRRNGSTFDSMNYDRTLGTFSGTSFNRGCILITYTDLDCPTNLGSGL